MGDSSYLYVDLVGALAVGEVGQPGAEANAGISRELMEQIQIAKQKKCINMRQFALPSG